MRERFVGKIVIRQYYSGEQKGLGFLTTKIRCTVHDDGILVYEEVYKVDKLSRHKSPVAEFVNWVLACRKARNERLFFKIRLIKPLRWMQHLKLGFTRFFESR